MQTRGTGVLQIFGITQKNWWVLSRRILNPTTSTTTVPLDWQNEKGKISISGERIIYF